MLAVYNALRDAQLELTDDEMSLLIHMVQSWSDPLDPNPLGLPRESPVFGPGRAEWQWSRPVAPGQPER
jgi:hypothetical protein